MERSDRVVTRSQTKGSMGELPHSSGSEVEEVEGRYEGLFGTEVGLPRSSGVKSEIQSEGSDGSFQSQQGEIEVVYERGEEGKVERKEATGGVDMTVLASLIQGINKQMLQDINTNLATMNEKSEARDKKNREENEQRFEAMNKNFESMREENKKMYEVVKERVELNEVKIVSLSEKMDKSIYEVNQKVENKINTLSSEVDQMKYNSDKLQTQVNNIYESQKVELEGEVNVINNKLKTEVASIKEQLNSNLESHKSEVIDGFKLVTDKIGEFKLASDKMEKVIASCEKGIDKCNSQLESHEKILREEQQVNLNNFKLLDEKTNDLIARQVHQNREIEGMYNNVAYSDGTARNTGVEIREAQNIPISPPIQAAGIQGTSHSDCAMKYLLHNHKVPFYYQFQPYKDISPLPFIREIKKTYMLHDGAIDLHALVMNNVGKGVLAWLEANESILADIKNFERHFLQKYWNTSIQEEIRDWVSQGKFLKGNVLEPDIYASKLYTAGRSLDDPIHHEKLIKLIIQHFHGEFGKAQRYYTPSSLDELTEVLNKYSKSDLYREDGRAYINTIQHRSKFGYTNSNNNNTNGNKTETNKQTNNNNNNQNNNNNSDNNNPNNNNQQQQNNNYNNNGGGRGNRFGNGRGRGNYSGQNQQQRFQNGGYPNTNSGYNNDNRGGYQNPRFQGGHWQNNRGRYPNVNQGGYSNEGYPPQNVNYIESNQGMGVNPDSQGGTPVAPSAPYQRTQEQLEYTQEVRDGKISKEIFAEGNPV